MKLKENSLCPYCNWGTIRLKTSRYGEYLACDDYPKCGAKENINPPLDVGQAGFKDNIKQLK